MTDIKYINLDIRVFPAADGQLRILYTYPGVEPSTGLERIYQPPIGYETALTGRDTGTRHSWRLAPGSEGPDGPANLKALQTAGDVLYAALIPKETEGLLSLAESVETPIRVRLRIDLTQAPELCATPWEALYRKASNKLLATTVNTTVVRLLDPDDQQQQTPIQGPLRVLIAVAIPDGELAGDVEIANIQRRVDQLAKANADVTRLEFQDLQQTNRKTLRQKVWEFKPHVIHYIGHGEFRDGRGFLLLHDQVDPQQPDALDAGALADLCQNDRPRLVVLNTCQGATADLRDPFAGSAQSLIRSNIPYVVAMQSPISDDAAITFAEEFYSVLVAGEPIDAAVSRGRNAIRLMQDETAQTELITPVLYCSGPIAPLVAPIRHREAPPMVPPLTESRVKPKPDGASHTPQIAIGALAATVLLLTGALGTLLLTRQPVPTVATQDGAGSPPEQSAPSAHGSAQPDVGAGNVPEIEESIIVGAEPPPLMAGAPPPIFVDMPENSAAALNAEILARNEEIELRERQEQAAYALDSARWDAEADAMETARTEWEADAAAFGTARVQWEQYALAYPSACWLGGCGPSAAFVAPKTSQTDPDYAWTVALPDLVEGPMTVGQRDSLLAMADQVRTLQALVEIHADDATAQRARTVLLLNGVPGRAVVVSTAPFAQTPEPHAEIQFGVWDVSAGPASYFFESGTTDPLDHRGLPEATAAWLTQRPAEVGLRVVGHTDATGAADYNNALAVARAEAIVRTLVDAGTPRERISSFGAGAQAATYGPADAFARRVDVEATLRGAESVTLASDGLMADAEPALDAMATFLTHHAEVRIGLRFRTGDTASADISADQGRAEVEQVRTGLADRGIDPARIDAASPLIANIRPGSDVASPEPARVDLILMF